ncbi:MAG: hypothetical protein RIM72_14875 [Alphaproteobacteria bacterium]
MASTSRAGGRDRGKSSNKPLIIASIFMVFCVVGPLAGFYAFSNVGSLFSGNNISSTVILHTKPFALGDRSASSAIYVASMKLPAYEDAERLCDYMPLIRDAINRFAQTQREVSADRPDSLPKFDVDRLGEYLREAARPTKILRVSLIEADEGVRDFAKNNVFLSCFGDRLYSSRPTE